MYSINLLLLFGVEIALRKTDELLVHVDLLLQKSAENFSLWFFRRLKTNSFWLAKTLTWLWFIAMVCVSWLLLFDKLTRDPNIYFLAGVFYTAFVAEWAYLVHKSLEYDEKRAFKAHERGFPNPKKRNKFFRLTISWLIAGVIITLVLLVFCKYRYGFVVLCALSPLPMLIGVAYLSACNYSDPEKVEDFITYI